MTMKSDANEKLKAMQEEMNMMSRQATIAAEDGNKWAQLFKDAIGGWSTTIDDLTE